MESQEEVKVAAKPAEHEHHVGHKAELTQGICVWYENVKTT
jgi:hypothetical protein